MNDSKVKPIDDQQAHENVLLGKANLRQQWDTILNHWKWHTLKLLGKTW